MLSGCFVAHGQPCREGTYCGIASTRLETNSLRTAEAAAHSNSNVAPGSSMNWSSWLAKVPAMKEPRNTVITCNTG